MTRLAPSSRCYAARSIPAGRYRNSGQQTMPAAKIIANAQKNFFFIVGQFSKKGTEWSRSGSTRPIPPSP
jgi:hypothetical protein